MGSATGIGSRPRQGRVSLDLERAAGGADLSTARQANAAVQTAAIFLVVGPVAGNFVLVFVFVIGRPLVLGRVPRSAVAEANGNVVRVAALVDLVAGRSQVVSPHHQELGPIGVPSPFEFVGVLHNEREEVLSAHHQYEKCLARPSALDPRLYGVMRDDVVPVPVLEGLEAVRQLSHLPARTARSNREALVGRVPYWTLLAIPWRRVALSLMTHPSIPAMVSTTLIAGWSGASSTLTKCPSGSHLAMIGTTTRRKS
jgi:hypothetical protein